MIRGAAIAAIAAMLLATPAVAQDDTSRPALHFSPQRNWINDPNGLVYDDGEWHLFYQYNPHGDRWGHMSWGHAVSRDLHRWTELPVAIPEAEVAAFSGSAVIDRANTSGLGTQGRPPMVALFTGWNEATGRQAQYLAYSNDHGRHFTRFGTAPVLDIGSSEFRDPKIFWDAGRRRWAMVLVLATDNVVAIYSSPNLKHWTRRGSFGPAGARAQAWECPDLFPLPVAGQPGVVKWVLNVGLNEHAPGGGSGSQYFVGSFDGDRFVADPDWPRTPVFVDRGADFYANVSWNDAPDDRRIWLAWASDWRYARNVPTWPARGIMTLPRELGLVRTPAGYRLTQRPTAEFAALLPRTLTRTDISLTARPVPIAVPDGPVEIAVELDAASAEQVVLEIADSAGHRTLIGAIPRIGGTPGMGEAFLDRTRAAAHFHDAFPDRHTAPVPMPGGRVALTIVVDRSIVELFAAGGTQTITDRIFPVAGPLRWSAYTIGGAATIRSLTIRSAQ